jgi:hypothetical protein
MGLKETQANFVRLSLGDTLGRQVHEEDGCGNPHEFQRLKYEIQIHSRLLINKRLALLKNILWKTYSIIGSDFSDEFRKFAIASAEPKGVNRHRLDALAFAKLLYNQIRNGKYPPQLVDLLIHETIPLRMWIEKKRFFFQFHKRRPSDLCRMIAVKGSITNVPFRPSFLFWREGNKGKRGYFWREFSPYIF